MVEQLIVPLKLAIYNRLTVSSVQDMIAYHGVQFISEVVADQLVLSLSTYINSAHADKFLYYHEYPETWWDAFKLRFFPKWLIDKYPVKFKVIDISVDKYILCPHISLENPKAHQEWIYKVMLETQNG